MKRHILTIHEGHKDDKCESGNKSITSNLDLTKHNKANHESLKEYKWPLKSHPQFVNRWYLASNSSHLDI